jgi:hypothetical protein
MKYESDGIEMDIRPRFSSLLFSSCLALPFLPGLDLSHSRIDSADINFEYTNPNQTRRNRKRPARYPHYIITSPRSRSLPLTEYVPRSKTCRDSPGSRGWD